MACEKLIDQAVKMARLDGNCGDYCLYIDGKAVYQQAVLELLCVCLQANRWTYSPS